MNLIKISVKLSYLLRHCKDPLYIELDGGWAPVETILEVLGSKFPGMNRQVLDEIVETDNKKRYSYNKHGDKIRANQGHSIPGVVIRMEQPEPPEYLYHGTAKRFLPSILREGLKPMTRNYVHLSWDYETAVSVGARHGEPVVLLVRAKAYTEAGYELYISDNGVWQAGEIPPEFFTVAESI